MQTKKDSRLEAVTNTAISYLLALVIQLLVFPLYDINIPLASNLQIIAIFTSVSIVRNYIVRRYFNKKEVS